MTNSQDPERPAATTLKAKADKLLKDYDEAMAAQRHNGPDAKLLVMANYGDLALGLLRTLVAHPDAEAAMGQMVRKYRIEYENHGPDIIDAASFLDADRIAADLARRDRKVITMITPADERS